MKTMKANTKKGQYFIDAYNRATARRISEVYDRPSTAKSRAEMWCLSEMCREDGHGYKVISHNCMKFTAGWRNALGLRIETADNTYQVVF